MPSPVEPTDPSASDPGAAGVRPDARPDVLVIGGGNIGVALVTGLLRNLPASAVAIVEVSAERRAQLSELVPGVAVGATVVPARTAVIAVKPPDAAAAAAAAAAAGVERVVSVAAGITTATLEAAIADVAAPTAAPVAVIRAMPNTPALVGRAVTAICPGGSARPDDMAEARRIVEAVGVCVELDEAHFDAVTAVTGSGPAYVFLVAEALQAAAVTAGLPADAAEVMVTELLVGSAALLAERGDPAALRAMVTSPNGTTAAGIAALEARDLRGALDAAVRAAAQRSAELAAGR